MRVKVGKHKGKLYSEVPIDYLKWMLTASFDKKTEAHVRKAIANHNPQATLFDDDLDLEYKPVKQEGKSEFFARKKQEAEDAEMKLLSKIVGYKVIM